MTSYQLKTQIPIHRDGDNLKMLKDVPDESIDLCYIDPPFNSNRNIDLGGNSNWVRFFDFNFYPR